MHTPIGQKTVSIAQAAEASSLSTIRNLIRDGKLRAGRVRTRVVIQADSLDELLDNAVGARIA